MMTKEEIIIKMAERMSQAFVWDKRNDETKFCKLKDDSPAWMTEVIYKAHEDKLPDDTVYRFIEKAVDAIAEADPASIEDAIFEIESDVYTSDLTEWLNERNDHVCYLTEALINGDHKDGFELLASAQYQHITEVAQGVLNALTERAERTE